MAAMGVENEVVCCDTPDKEWIGSDAFPLHALGPGRFGFSYTPKLGPWLRENARRFDAVVVHGMWQWPGICTVRALASGRKPNCFSNSPPVTRHPLLFVMPHGMLDPWFQRDRSRQVKAVRNWFYWWMVERWVVNGAAGLLFTCQEELRLARTTFGGYRPRRELNVGYGIEEPPEFSERMRAAFLKKVPGLGERRYLLFLGRIHPKKGVEMLVRAFARVRSELTSARSPEVREFPELVIAGPGWDSDYGREVRGLIDEANRSISSTKHRTLKTENSAPIHIVDMLSGAEKWGALHGCEAFVLPSHQENFGIAVVEALGCGRPVLISNKVNIWREISEDGAGLVEEDSLEGTARLLALFAAGELAGGDSGRFRECFRRRFEIQQAARRLLEAVGGEQKCRAGVPPAM
jgi:glycosyltransferase involved in cell wall biosynthesis